MSIGSTTSGVPQSPLFKAAEPPVSKSKTSAESSEKLFQKSGEQLKESARERLELARERLKALLLLSIISPEAVLRHAKFLAKELANISNMYGQAIDIELSQLDTGLNTDKPLSSDQLFDAQMARYTESVALSKADREFALYISTIKTSIETAVKRAEAQIEDRERRERRASDMQAIKGANEALREAGQAIKSLYRASTDHMFRSTNVLV